MSSPNIDKLLSVIDVAGTQYIDDRFKKDEELSLSYKEAIKIEINTLLSNFNYDHHQNVIDGDVDVKKMIWNYFMELPLEDFVYNPDNNFFYRSHYNNEQTKDQLVNFQKQLLNYYAKFEEWVNDTKLKDEIDEKGCVIRADSEKNDEPQIAEFKIEKPIWNNNPPFMYEIPDSVTKKDIYQYFREIIKLSNLSKNDLSINNQISLEKHLNKFSAATNKMDEFEHFRSMVILLGFEANKYILDYFSRTSRSASVIKELINHRSQYKVGNWSVFMVVIKLIFLSCGAIPTLVIGLQNNNLTSIVLSISFIMFFLIRIPIMLINKMSLKSESKTHLDFKKFYRDSWSIVHVPEDVNRYLIY